MSSKNLLAAAVVLTSAAFCACSPVESPETFGTSTQGLKVCAGTETVPGIDVSSWQGTIDWDQVAAAGNAFAITRINDGHHMDDQFQRNWAEIKRVGMIRGAYQFYEPALDSAWQAQVVVNAVGMLGDGDLPVTLDVEWPSTSGTPTVAGVRTWMDLVTAGTGKRPMIYTAGGYWNSYFGGEFSDITLWVANWGVSCPSLPNGWQSWLFWQPGGGPVPGISGNVDLDVFNGSLGLLQAVASAPGANHCGAQGVSDCGHFGCGCVDNACSGGFCPGTGCSAELTAACGNFGVGCSDGKCQGAYGPGSGCTAKDTLDCANFGCGCVDHQCNGGYCPGTGCTAREALDCGNFGVNCVDHQCSGGFGTGTGCTAKETNDCTAQGCGCVDHACSGGSCAGTGCTARQALDCGAKDCKLGACVDAPVTPEPEPTDPDPQPQPAGADAGTVVEIVAPDAGTAPVAAPGPDAGSVAPVDPPTTNPDPTTDPGTQPEPKQGTIPAPGSSNQVEGVSCSSAPGAAMPLAGWLLLALAARRRRGAPSSRA